MDGAADGAVPGHVDVDRCHQGQRLDVVVGHHAVVAAEPLHETDVGRRGEAHHLDAVALGGQEGGPDRGLARRAGQDDDLGPEEPVVGQVVVEQERGEEEGPQQHLLVLVPLVVDRIATDGPVGVVGGREVGPVGSGVDEAALVDPVGRDHEVPRHREVAEHAHPFGNVVAGRADDIAEAPHRDPAPAGLGGEEVPVRHRVAEHAVGDVVRGQAERVDAQQRLAGLEVGDIGTVVDPALVEVVAAYEEVHGASIIADCVLTSPGFASPGLASPALTPTAAVPRRPARPPARRSP